jgi:hypothetical protein
VVLHADHEVGHQNVVLVALRHAALHARDGPPHRAVAAHLEGDGEGAVAQQRTHGRVQVALLHLDVDDEAGTQFVHERGAFGSGGEGGDPGGEPVDLVVLAGEFRRRVRRLCHLRHHPSRGRVLRVNCGYPANGRACAHPGALA